MTDTDRPFGSAVTPPHRPRPLDAPASVAEAAPRHAGETHPAIGESGLRWYGETALVPRESGAALRLATEGRAATREGERAGATAYRARARRSGAHTSALILGEDEGSEEREEYDGRGADAYRCDVCGEAFDSERALERHVRRLGILE